MYGEINEGVSEYTTARSLLPTPQTVAGCKPGVAICFHASMRRRATLTANAIIVGAVGVALRGGGNV